MSSILSKSIKNLAAVTITLVTLAVSCQASHDHQGNQDSESLPNGKRPHLLEDEKTEQPSPIQTKAESPLRLHTRRRVAVEDLARDNRSVSPELFPDWSFQPSQDSQTHVAPEQAPQPLVPQVFETLSQVELAYAVQMTTQAQMKSQLENLERQFKSQTELYFGTPPDGDCHSKDIIDSVQRFLHSRLSAHIMPGTKLKIPQKSTFETICIHNQFDTGHAFIPEENIELRGLAKKCYVIKLWINGFFEQAQLRQQDQTLGVFHHRLTEAKEVFQHMISQIEATIRFAQDVRQDAYVNWPHNQGLRANVREFQSKWAQFHKTLYLDIRRNTDFMKNVFILYQDSTGYTLDEMRQQLFLLTGEEYVQDTSETVTTMHSQETFHNFLMTSFERGNFYNPYKLDDLANKEGLLREIRIFQDIHFYNVQPHPHIRQTYGTKTIDPHTDKIENFWRSLIDTYSYLHSVHSRDLFQSDEAKLLSGDLQWQGFRSILILNLLRHNIEHEGLREYLLRSMECCNEWLNRVKEFKLQHLPLGGVPIKLKTGD
jgi:hypothetical protein